MAGRPEPPPEPEVLCDRSLGRHIVPNALRGQGLKVHTLASVYGEARAQVVSDEEWLQLAGQRGWVVVMKDDRIRRRPAELEALVGAAVRAFCITNADLTGPQMATRLVDNLERIRRVVRRGPGRTSTACTLTMFGSSGRGQAIPEAIKATWRTALAATSGGCRRSGRRSRSRQASSAQSSPAC